MRTTSAAWALAAAACGFLTTASAAPASVPHQDRAVGHFASTKGTRFLLDGSTDYLAGTNSYWIGFLTDNADVDLVMSHLAQSGLKILRVWGFNDVTEKPASDSGTVYYQYLSANGSEINTGADGLQRLDYVVASAAKHGVKLIINFVNNWGDYGGMPAYVTAFGGTKESWYDNEAAQTQYRAYIRAVVSRYAKSSAVFAWELANEPRCRGCPTDTVYTWAAETSRYIKKLDPFHMVTLGDEGFGLPGNTTYPYTTYEGVDFVANLNISTLDFGTFHMYPSSWGVPNSFAPAWIADHAKACVDAGKPCLLEEYGITANHCSIETPWQQAALSSDGIASDMFWQYGDELSTGESPDDGNTIYFGSSDGDCLITDHAKAIKCKNHPASCKH